MKRTNITSIQFDIVEYKVTTFQSLLFYWRGIWRRAENLAMFKQSLSVKEDNTEIGETIFPDQYLIEPKELAEASLLRDKKIAKEQKRYQLIKQNLASLIEDTTLRLHKENKYLKSLESNREKIARQLAKATDAHARVSLQGRQEIILVSIANQKRHISQTEQEISTYLGLAQQNDANWKLQLAELQAVYHKLCEVFVRSATRRIRKKFGYAKFDFIPTPVLVDGVEISLQNKKMNSPRRRATR